MKIEIAHADTCTPDYWPGNRLPHVQIPIWPGMSLTDIKSAIRFEISQGVIAGSDDNARLLGRPDMVRADEEKRADRLTRAAYAAVNRIKPARKGQRRFFLDIEEPADDCEHYVYAFFVFIVEG